MSESDNHQTFVPRPISRLGIFKWYIGHKPFYIEFAASKSFYLVLSWYYGTKVDFRFKGNRVVWRLIDAHQ